VQRKMGGACAYPCGHNCIKICTLRDFCHARFGLVRICVRSQAQTASRLRPLARRALMTARPPLVFMRTKKPWVRARRVFEGW